PAGEASPARDWIAHRPSPLSTTIRPGDRISLVVWDPEENSLLSTPGQKVVDLRAAQVSPEGTVFAPYLGEITVANMTPAAARTHIQSYFEEIVPSAQVQLDHEPGRMNTVDLVGGVTSPGTVPLPDGNFTIMALLSQGGGVAAGLVNPQLRLVRQGRTYRISLKQLYDDPGLDTTLRGGDKVFVEEDDRQFLALGSTGREAIVPFPQDEVSALEAVTLSGGVNDNRANLKGLLILREYPAGAVATPASPPPQITDGAARAPFITDPWLAQGGPMHQRTIFVIDLTTADGLFSAGKFAVQPDDVVLATEAAVSNVRTVFGLIGNIFGIAAQSSTLAN
ncbi:MAG: polysaccharide biosynthesis/export family protein, partial [Roseovarius sp.]|nr:polysaccharide biosynthesis/export family protein [Roseovarius sp.]